MKRQLYFCSIYCLLSIKVIISILVDFIFSLIFNIILKDDQECTVSPPRWTVVSIEIHEPNEMEIHKLQGILCKCISNILMRKSGLGF